MRILGWTGMIMGHGGMTLRLGGGMRWTHWRKVIIHILLIIMC